MNGRRTTATMTKQLLMSVFVVAFFSVIAAVHAHVCYIGHEPDSSGALKWVLPYPDPCGCTDLRLGSLNARSLPRPFTPVYFNLSAVTVGDLNAVRKMLNCTKEEPITCETFSTTGYQYQYKFAALPQSAVGRVLIEFDVRAQSDVHIALVGQNSDMPDMYEVVIGGWNDQKTVIRRRRQGDSVAFKNDPNGWLDGETYKHFWVSATPGTDPSDDHATLTIAVGRGSDMAPFLSFVDRTPLPATHLGFSTWDSLVAQFEFCGLDLIASN